MPRWISDECFDSYKMNMFGKYCLATGYKRQLLTIYSSVRADASCLWYIRILSFSVQDAFLYEPLRGWILYLNCHSQLTDTPFQVVVPCKGETRSYFYAQYDVTSKNNNVSFAGLDIHYHRSSYQTCCYTSDNVCLDLKNWHYSIFIIPICIMSSSSFWLILYLLSDILSSLLLNEYDETISA